VSQSVVESWDGWVRQGIMLDRFIGRAFVPLQLNAFGMELHRSLSREIPQVGLAVQHVIVVVHDVRRFRVYPVHRSVGFIVHPVQSSEFRIGAGIPEDVADHRIFCPLAFCEKGM
jgi:hypothetical protein